MSNYENRVQRDLVTDAVFTESNEEFILPDYMPEIGRVLRVGATLLPEEHYAGSDSTEFSGRVEYRLLYSDSEGNVTEAPLEGRYRYLLPSGGADAPLTYTEERIESVNARPTAPRKLGIRARIFARPHMLKEEAIGTPVEALAGEDPTETLEREISILARIPFSSGIPTAEGSFTIEGASPDALTLLSTLSHLLPESKEVHDGYISVRGKLIFTLLLKKQEALPFVKVCSIPFEEEFPLDGAKAGDALSLRAALGAPTVSFEAAGEDTTLIIGADCTLSGVVLRNESVSVVEDLYVHGARHEIARKPFSTDSLIGTASGNVTVSADLPLPSDFKREGTLFPAFSVKESEISRVGDKTVVAGTLSASLLCFREDDIEKCELSLPFRAELPLASRESEGESFTATVTPIGGGAEPCGDGVRLSTELALSVTSTRPVTLSLPCAIQKLEDTFFSKCPTVTIYYPTDGDTLWSVGKRYGVPLSTLKKRNGMPESAESYMPLDGYAYLFVNGL